MQHSAQFKRGVVTLLDPKGRRVRVKIEDEDGTPSYWLSMLARGAKGMRQTHMPVVGEQVACLIDWRGEDGIILGSVYSDADPSPTGAAEVDHVTYSDGSVVEHDPKNSAYRVKLAGGNLLLSAGGTGIAIGTGGITSTHPITVGAMPNIPVRSS